MIFLSKYDIQFMLAVLALTPDLRLVLQSIPEGGDISDDRADELRDFCTDRLDEIGFDKNYTLTEEGRKLDTLVDKLFVS